jgi:hypothetical protein
VRPVTPSSALASLAAVLTTEQMKEFGTSGFLLLPGVVPDALLKPADAEIDAVMEADPPAMGSCGPHFYFHPVAQLRAADAALRESGALGLAEELVEPHGLEHAFDHIQIALNIPRFAHRPGGPHVDGHRPELASPGSFTMLAAIYLSDESAPDSGNLWVWPGSHLVHESLFSTRGPRALLDTSGHTGLLEDPPPLVNPQPVLARRGDLLLAHFLLGHNTGGNTSSRTRRVLYYRLQCPGHPGRWDETFRHAWTEYAPVRRVLDPG